MGDWQFFWLLHIFIILHHMNGAHWKLKAELFVIF